MSDSVVLETERLVLTPWRADQLDDVIRLHSDTRVARYYSEDGKPWSQRKCSARLSNWIDEHLTLALGKQRVTSKADGALIGRAGFSLHSATGIPELGYAMFPQYWGRGYATEAAAGLRDWFFETRSDPYFIAFAHVDNSASLAVLEKIGMLRTEIAEHNGMPHQFFRHDRPVLP